jgi:hypothetical protein
VTVYPLRTHRLGVGLTSRGRAIGGLGSAVALAALLCLAMALVPAGAFAAGGSISGKVTAFSIALGGPGANPIEGVEVCAWSLASEEEWFCAETDAEGNYEIAGLENDEYGVEFWGRPVGYELQFYNGRENWWEADPVVVEGGPVTGVNAGLIPLAGIEGTVTRSSDGEPVEEVEVCAWPLSEEGFGGCTGTAGDGSYLISGLEPGEYKVEFWPGFTGQNLAYQFYKDRDRWLEADAVVVESEETTPGIDAELHPGATIGGTVSRAATGVPLEEVRVCSIDGPTGQLWICTRTETNGTYELPFHSKGQYKVVFSVNIAEWFGEEEDGFPNQYWNNQATLAAANVVPLASGQAVFGIDARLGPPAPTVVVPPVVVKTPVHHKRKHCRKGFVRKKIKGKARCVRRHRHPHHAGARLTTQQRPLFRVG